MCLNADIPEGLTITSSVSKGLLSSIYHDALVIGCIEPYVTQQYPGVSNDSSVLIWNKMPGII